MKITRQFIKKNNFKKLFELYCFAPNFSVQNLKRFEKH